MPLRKDAKNWSIEVFGSLLTGINMTITGGRVQSSTVSIASGSPKRKKNIKHQVYLRTTKVIKVLLQDWFPLD